LVNLAGNATKFTSNGEINVSVNLEQEIAQDVVLRFSVRDTGIGIPSNMQKNLFDKFTQVDFSTSRKYGGTGLGLAISKQLAELMGGEIGVQSVPGRGSEFWFTARFEKQPQHLSAGDADTQVRELDTILVEGPAAASPIERDAENELPRASLRVLVAEDNITNQQVALGILRKLGVRAEAVANGQEAIEALRQIPYDLVFMDVQMPEMDGFDATRAVRATSGILRPSVPIIAMTAHAMLGDREKCLEAGMNDYIAKPITPAAVSRTIDEWLAKLKAGRKVRESPAATDRDHAARAIQIADDGTPIFLETALLDRLMGDHEMAKVVALGFLGDIPKQIETLLRVLDAHDTQAVERQAHSIKGAAAAVGGEALRNLAGALERAAKANDLVTVSASLAELENQFDRLRRAMQASLLAPSGLALVSRGGYSAF